MNTPDAPVVAALAAVTRQRRLRALRAGGSAARAIPGERAPALQRVL